MICTQCDPKDSWKREARKCLRTMYLPLEMPAYVGDACYFTNRSKRAQAFQRLTGDAPNAAHWLSDLSEYSDLAVSVVESAPILYTLLGGIKGWPPIRCVRFLEKHKSPKKCLRALECGSWALRISPNTERYDFETLMQALNAAHPSSVSQAITAAQSRGELSLWVRQVAQWASWWKRRTRKPLFMADYAVRRVFGIAKVIGDLPHFLDFVASKGDDFNERWTDDRLLIELQAWEANAALLAEQAAQERYDLVHGFPETACIDGVEFTVLRSPAALAIEGVAMRHCVGSYARYVRTGQSVIYAVRGNEKRATLEVGIGPDNNIGLSQIKGPRNAKPAVEIEEAAKRLIADVSKKLSAR